MRRISSPTSDLGGLLLTAAMALALGSCGSDEDRAGTPFKGDGKAGKASTDEISCALDGASGFSNVCTRTIIPGEEANQLILVGPDGSFRRFVILTDGRGLEAADGAEQPRIELLGDNQIQVSIGGDVYHLPARLKAAQSMRGLPDE